MRYRTRTNNQPRTIIAKYAGKCHCCNGAIKAGEMVDYNPANRTIAHHLGLNGDSARCSYEIGKRMNNDGGFDLDRMYEDQCADICGR